MPISLVDYENLITDKFSVGMFRQLVRMNPIVKLFPVVRKKSLRVTAQVWDELPTAAFRDLNEQFTDSTGKTHPAEERPAILGGSFKADKVLDELNEGLYIDPAQQQFNQYNVSIDRTLTDHIFNGNIDANPKAFNGLYKRFGITDGFPTTAQISLNQSNDSLKVLASAANAQLFFDGLDDAMYEAGLWGSGIDGVPRGALFLNKTTFKGFQRAARLTGYSLYTVDLLGYTWHSYMGIPLVDVGLKADKATEIILNTYDPGDAGNDASRIYCVRFSPPDGDIDSPGASGLSLLEVSPYKVLGPEDYAEYQRWALQWIVGLVYLGDPYCVSLLEHFKMAAS